MSFVSIKKIFILKTVRDFSALEGRAMPLVIISSEARPLFLPCIFLRFGARRAYLSPLFLSPLADFTTATGMFLLDAQTRVDGGLPAKV